MLLHLACLSLQENLKLFIEKKHFNLKLKYILNTHHHTDHVGGNIELKNKFNQGSLQPKPHFYSLKWLKKKILK